MSGTLVMTCSIEYNHFVAEELSFMYNHQALWTFLAASRIFRTLGTLFGPRPVDLAVGARTEVGL